MSLPSRDNKIEQSPVDQKRDNADLRPFLPNVPNKESVKNRYDALKYQANQIIALSATFPTEDQLNGKDWQGLFAVHHLFKHASGEGVESLKKKAKEQNLDLEQGVELVNKFYQLLNMIKNLTAQYQEAYEIANGKSIRINGDDLLSLYSCLLPDANEVSDQEKLFKQMSDWGFRFSEMSSNAISFSETMALPKLNIEICHLIFFYIGPGAKKADFENPGLNPLGAILEKFKAYPVDEKQTPLEIQGSPLSKSDLKKIKLAPLLPLLTGGQLKQALTINSSSEEIVEQFNNHMQRIEKAFREDFRIYSSLSFSPSELEKLARLENDGAVFLYDPSGEELASNPDMYRPSIDHVNDEASNELNKLAKNLSDPEDKNVPESKNNLETLIIRTNLGAAEATCQIYKRYLDKKLKLNPSDENVKNKIEVVSSLQSSMKQTDSAKSESQRFENLKIYLNTLGDRLLENDFPKSIKNLSVYFRYHQAAPDYFCYYQAVHNAINAKDAKALLLALNEFGIYENNFSIKNNPVTFEKLPIPEFAQMAFAEIEKIAGRCEHIKKGITLFTESTYLPAQAPAQGVPVLIQEQLRAASSQEEIDNLLKDQIFLADHIKRVKKDYYAEAEYYADSFSKSELITLKEERLDTKKNAHKEAEELSLELRALAAEYLKNPGNPNELIAQINLKAAEAGCKLYKNYYLDKKRKLEPHNVTLQYKDNAVSFLQQSMKQTESAKTYQQRVTAFGKALIDNKSSIVRHRMTRFFAFISRMVSRILSRTQQPARAGVSHGSMFVNFVKNLQIIQKPAAKPKTP